MIWRTIVVALGMTGTSPAWLGQPQVFVAQSVECEAAKTRVAVETCRAEQAIAAAVDKPASSLERRRDLERAVSHFRVAANIADGATRLAVLARLRTILGPMFLADTAGLEAVVVELLTMSPYDLELLFELARIQEARGDVDAAETTLVDSRRAHPAAVEPNRKLAQFYSRRITTLQRTQDDAKDEVRTPPGEADKDGVYRVGRNIVPPKRLTRLLPTYPRIALEAGVEGVVTVDVTIDATGRVQDAAVRRSVPLLDETALESVRKWQYAPTVVDGVAVPVKMTVVVPFQRPRP